MAAIDFLLLLCSILLFGLPAILSNLIESNENWHNSTDFLAETVTETNYILHRMMPCTYFFAMAAQTASVYITITVTIERWLAVCYPLLGDAAGWHMHPVRDLFRF